MSAESERGSANPWARALGHLAAGCASRWRLVLVLSVLSLVCSILVVSRMHIESSLEAMLGSDAQAAGAMHRVTTRYRSGDALMVLVSADGPAEVSKRAALLRHAELLSNEIARADRQSGRVAWVRTGPDPALARFAAETMLPAGIFYLDAEGLRAFSERVQPPHMAEQFSRNESMVASPGPAGSALSDRVLADPLRLMELVPAHLREKAETEFSTDERAVLIRIGGLAPLGDLNAAGALYDLVQEVIEATRRQADHEGLRVEIGGAAPIAATASRTIRRDSIVSTLVSVALLYSLFAVFYRRWFAALLIGAVAGVGTLAGFAAYAGFSATVSPLAAAVAALLAGLGVDYGIHFLSHYHVCRAAGAPVHSAVRETAERMAVPIVTNCMTSMFGFASLWASNIKMLRDFAMMGSAGLLGALIAVFVLMPALLALCDERSRLADGRAVRFSVVATVVARRPRMSLASAVIILATLLVVGGARGLVPTLEADLTKLHPQPNDALRVTHEILSRFGSQGDMLPVELRASSGAALVTQSHLAAARLRSPECVEVGVKAVLGLHQLLPDPAHEDEVRAAIARMDAKAFVSDFDKVVEGSVFRREAYVGYRDAVARMMATTRSPGIADVLRYRSIAERLFPAAQLDSAECVTETVLLVRLELPLRDRGLRDATVARLRTSLGDLPGATVAGLPAVSMELEAATREGLPLSLGISLCLVIVWLLFVFRSPSNVLLTLVPLVCAATAVVGFMAVTRTALNPINCVALPLLDGIAVDAGVFLVAVWREHRGNRDQLVAELRPTVHAVLLAVATTITGFASMCFTSTPAIRSLGVIAAVGIAGSLLGAIGVLMPILILRAGARKGR